MAPTVRARTPQYRYITCIEVNAHVTPLTRTPLISPSDSIIRTTIMYLMNMYQFGSLLPLTGGRAFSPSLSLCPPLNPQKLLHEWEQGTGAEPPAEGAGGMNWEGQSPDQPQLLPMRKLCGWDPAPTAGPEARHWEQNPHKNRKT